MSVDYAKQIEEAVVKVCVATGKTRAELAQEMGYTPTYISSAINRGGNKKLLDTIKQKYAFVFNEKKVPAVDHYEQALLKALVTDYIKLKSQLTKKSVDDIADELDQNTKLILRELKK